jgi:hypothetical protein
LLELEIIVTLPGPEATHRWQGRTLVDHNGEPLGNIEIIYLDKATEQPEWALLEAGTGGPAPTFVPLVSASEEGDTIRVPFDKALVEGAPSLPADRELSEDQEGELYRHYGLDYDSVTLASGAPADQTLTEPAGQTDKPDRTDQAGATAIRLPEPAGTATGGLADTGIDAEPGTPASESGSPGLGRGPDASSTESEPVGPAGQGRLPVGEGVSRPFVYETPGRPAGGAGTRRRQPGQVRLRRYLVTEVVTDTEAGQRHEVRVQREPVSDAEVDAVRTAPDRQDELIGQEPNGPDHHDWFSDESGPRH